MKIAMIGLRGLDDGLGGVEKAVREVSLRMANNGHDVTCYCKDLYSKKKSHENVNLINIKTWHGKYLETLIYSLRAILHASKGNYDIIHIHALASSCLAWIPKFIFKKKVVITVHGLDWQRAKWGLIARQVLKLGELCSVKFADVTLCVSKSLCMYYRMKYSKSTVKYIPNGCDIDSNVYAPHKDFQKDSYFLFMGRLVQEKGIHNLISAFNQIETDKSLVIAGPAFDKKYETELHELANGNPKIHFIGSVKGDEKLQLLSNAFLFVLPSEIEGLPIALLEAASYGVCTAVSDIPTCEEVVDSPSLPYGYKFSLNDPNELKVVLKSASDSDCIVKALGTKLKTQVKENYNWDLISRESIEAYHLAA
ncbi:MAG: glycosyltransferase family 4 protein [Lentisphaeraceae bacterium]|nr:glycosyltransferase family 4 protein [Lentisphaeraceae bacterium]